MNIIFDKIIPGYDHYKLYIYNTDNYPVPNKYILYKEKPEYAGFREYDGYTYEDYLIDKTDYQNVSNKSLVYNIKYYHHIEPDGTYVYESDWWQESFPMTFSCQNTKYDYVKFDYSHSDNFSFIHIRMYPIWGIYIDPFWDLYAKYFKVTQKEAFGPMTNGIENRTEEKEILYLTIHSPNNEEVYKFKCIKYPKNLSIGFQMANQSDKSKQYVDFNSNAQSKSIDFGYYGELEDLIVENNNSFISYTIKKIKSGSTRGNNHTITITVTENNTGETRSGSLFLKMSNGTEERKAELFVTQLWYVPRYATINGFDVKTGNRQMASRRLVKIQYNQKTISIKVKHNVDVKIRRSTEYSFRNWPEFVEEIENGERILEYTGGEDETPIEEIVTFNVISENNTNETKQGWIEFAIYDIYDNKLYKLGIPIWQLAKENEDVQNS